MATQVGSLYTSLTLDSASFVSNMKRSADAAEQGAAQISKALSVAKTAALGFAAAFVTDQLLDLAKGATDFASSLGETAEQLGISAKGLQELRYAATQSGASIEEADKAIGKFSVNVGKARDGNEKLRDAFAAVGVSVNDLRSLNTEGLFAKVAEGIAKIPDPARRASSEVALLGKGGQALGVVLNSGSDGIRAFADEAERAGVVVSDKAITALDNLNDSGDRLKLVFNAQLANLIGNNADAIIAIGNAASGAIGQLGGFLNQMRGVAALVSRGDLLGVVTNSAQSLEKLGTNKGIASYDADKVRGLQKQVADSAGKTVITFGRSLETQLAEAQKTAAGSRASVFSDIMSSTEGGFFSARDNSGSFDVAAGKAKKVKAPRAARATKPDLFAASAADVRAGTATFGGPLDPLHFSQLKDQSDDISKALGDQVDEFIHRFDALNAVIGKPIELDISANAAAGMKTLADQAERAERAGNGFADDLSSGLANALVDGKNLGDVLVSSLKRAAAEALSSQLFKLLGGGGNGQATTGIASFIGNLFTPHANGGPVTPGTTYLVGERGPELFRSGSGGSIIPNSAIKAANDNRGQRLDVHVTSEPSPLLVNTVTVGASNAGRQAATDTLNRATRGSIPRGRGV